MMIKTKTLLVLSLLIPLSFAGGLLAADEAPPPSNVQKKPQHCKDDIQKYCKDVQKGDGRIAQCLEQHEAEVTPPCKHHMARAKLHRELKVACSTDMKTYCPKPEGDQKGKPHLRQCLEENKSKLSKTCQDKLNEPKPGVETLGGVM